MLVVLLSKEIIVLSFFIYENYARKYSMNQQLLLDTADQISCIGFIECDFYKVAGAEAQRYC